MSDSYFIAKIVALIFGLIIISILSFFKYRSEKKKEKGTYLIHKNNERAGTNLNINNSYNNEKPNSISTNLNKLPSLYFRAIKYPLWGYLMGAIIIGLIMMAIHFMLGVGILILLVVLGIFSHNNYIKSLVYIGLTIDDQKIIINKYPPNADQIIQFEGVCKISFEDIYQKDGKGFDQKVGCEIIFWNKEDSIIDTFDVEKFKKSEQVKLAIFKRIGIS
jgi:hypothetical protein